MSDEEQASNQHLVELRAINVRLRLILRTLVTIAALLVGMFATGMVRDPSLVGVGATVFAYLIYHSWRNLAQEDSDGQLERTSK
ncbi:MAG: hypothetical protein H8E37_11330 [Planctomycetes bacterium]|nr:hypothetical protein [Planctomycetota bacterium]